MAPPSSTTVVNGTALTLAVASVELPKTVLVAI
jgi:hypothetical protein